MPYRLAKRIEENLKITTATYLSILTLTGMALMGWAVYKLYEHNRISTLIFQAREEVRFLSFWFSSMGIKKVEGLSRFLSPNKREIVVTDMKGRVLFSSSRKSRGIISKIPQDNPFFIIKKKDRFFFPRYRNLIVNQIARLPGGNRIVIYLIKDIRMVNDGLDRLRGFILYLVFLDSSLITLFCFYLIRKFIIDHIIKILEFVKQLERGKYSEKLDIKVSNEIGMLVRSLNQLARTLEEKERDLKLSQEETIRAEKLSTLGQIAAGLAHEVGNPLGIIQGYIGLLQKSKLSDEQKRDLLKRMEKETDRIQSIIKFLLDYAHPGSRKRENIDLANLLRETLSFLLIHKDYKKHRIVYELPENLYVKGDPALIKQAFLNIFLNAFQAMGDKNGSLYVKGWHDRKNIYVQIRDTGPGMSKDQIRRIFDPFFTTKDPGEGTGLGLTISYRIIEIHGGKIRVESKIDKGTTFTVMLPGEEINGRKEYTSG